MDVPLNAERASRPKLPRDIVAVTFSRTTASLLVPVTLTILLVSWGVTNLTPIYVGRDVSPVYLVADETSSSSTTEKLTASIVNALCVVAVIVVVTFIMVLLYKYRCTMILSIWLIFSAVLMLGMLLWVWLDLMFVRFQIPYDIVTIAVVLWNVGVAGTISIFYYASPIFTQTSLIIVSVVGSWVLTRFPDWTTWTILLAVAVYDIVAVLCPKGPLRMLLEESSRRSEPIPGFVYDSSTDATMRLSKVESGEAAPGNAAPRPRKENAVNPVPGGGASSSDRVASGVNVADSVSVKVDSPPEQSHSKQTASQRRRDPSNSVSVPHTHESLLMIVGGSPFKLGLGDFMFYGLLVGKAASYALAVWLMSLLAVLVGLVGTLSSLLFMRGKLGALPALPISIFIGVATCLLARVTVLPLSVYVSQHALPL